MRKFSLLKFAGLALVIGLPGAGLSFAAADSQQAIADETPVIAPAELPAPAEPPTVILSGGELESMTGPLIRMVLSLMAVLALVGVFAWLAKRFRGSQMQGGLIQIVSGLSLGPKEKVVLLRVGQEEILVGLSPAGMRSLHVMDRPSSANAFSLDMADKPGDGKQQG